MASETIVHVVRHGEVHNPEGILYGRLPGYHLSDTGVKMAKRVADALAGRNVIHLRCSPLERAQETMAMISVKYPELSVVFDENLTEADNALAGQVFGESNKALKNPKNWLLYRNPFRPSWGEPYAQIAVRMQAAITEAAEQAGAGEAILVSHQLPIWIARLAFEGRRLWHDPRSRQCTVASVTSFHFDQGRFSRITYSEPALDLVPVKARAAVFSSGRNTKK